MWPVVALSELLQQVSRPENVDATKRYKILGAHWYAKGLYTKDTKAGSEIQAATLYRVLQGDFVYNRLFAWKGSFALATAENSGCYVSNEFPVFTVREDRLVPQFLALYLTREASWNEALGLSSGGTPTSRNRLKEEKFLAMKIPLPAVEEQRKIAARFTGLTAKIQEAANLTEASVQSSLAVCRAISASDREARVPMSEIVRLRQPDVSVYPDQTYHFAGVYCFGRGVFPSQSRAGSEFAYKKLTTLHRGDFVYPKLMAWEGAFGVVPNELDGRVVSTEFPVFEIMQDKVLPEVLDVHFSTPSTWEDVAGGSTGTNVRRRRLNPKDFLRYRMPLPSRSTQKKLQEVHRRALALNRLWSENQQQLGALLASVLNGIFPERLS